LKISTIRSNAYYYLDDEQNPEYNNEIPTFLQETTDLLHIDNIFDDYDSNHFLILKSIDVSSI
jgi:hypothetical protein